MTTDTHAPGPMVVGDFGLNIDGKSAVRVYWDEGTKDAEYETVCRLLAGSYNSYRKHFGTHAVAAAEGDWIGRAVELLREIVAADDVEKFSMEDIGSVVSHKVESIRSLIAEVQR